MNDIIIYSRTDAEKARRSRSLPKNTSVISFYDPQTEHIKYEDICSDVYYCPYDDIDVWSEREYEKYSSTFDFADDLARFIYDAEISSVNAIMVRAGVQAVPLRLQNIFTNRES